MKKQGVHNVHEAKWIASVELLIFWLQRLGLLWFGLHLVKYERGDGQNIALIG